MTASGITFQPAPSADKTPSRNKKTSLHPHKVQGDESTKLLAMAEEVAHFGSWKWDTTQPRAIWSIEMFRIFGLEPTTQGLTLEEYRRFIHPDDIEDVTKTMQSVFSFAKVNQKSELDYRIVRPDGSVRILHSQRQIKELTDDGKVKVTVGVDQDVTEQRQAEELLKKSEERFRIVAEAANVMVYEIDVSTDKLDILQGVKQLLGYEPGEVSLNTAWALSKIHPDDVQHVIDTWNKVRDNPEIDRYVLEYRIQNKDGNYLFVKDTAKAIKNDEGKKVQFIGGIRDITQRKRNREMLKQYSKHLEELVEDRTKQLINYERLAAIGQVAGMVGHDIRNPLQALISEVYLIQSEIDDRPKTQEILDISESLASIEENINYINKIVADLQDYSRQLDPEYRLVNIGDLIVDMFKAITVPRSIKLSFRIDAPEKVYIDPTFTRRALTNLINNAIQAMPNGGNLEISCIQSNDTTSFSVADTGVGIPDEVKGRLFTPLFTTKSKGQGLGLAVVKRLVEAQGGSICFESKLNKGTKFIITLPKH